jgi:hypothetical protein
MAMPGTFHVAEDMDYAVRYRQIRLHYYVLGGFNRR